MVKCLKKIPLLKKVKYKGKSYSIEDFFKGKYKIRRPGEKIKWVSPRTIKVPRVCR